MNDYIYFVIFLSSVGICEGLFIIFLNVCPFDSWTVARSRNVGTSYHKLTTPVGLLLSLQLNVLSRSVIVL